MTHFLAYLGQFKSKSHIQGYLQKVKNKSFHLTPSLMGFQTVYSKYVENKLVERNYIDGRYIDRDYKEQKHCIKVIIQIQSPNLEIGTLSKQSKSISNINQCSRFVSKVMKCTSEAHKSSWSCYQSFRKIGKFYQNLLGSYLVNETYRISLIGDGKKGKRQIFMNLA